MTNDLTAVTELKIAAACQGKRAGKERLMRIISFEEIMLF
jgi:hypothetical protein